MILGATVDQLKLAQQVKPQYFPVLGKFWAQLKGRTPPEITLVAEYPTAQRQAANAFPHRPGERALSS
jgi:uncharacterized protein involved in exopolysaccharide biosynthesis